MSDIQKILATVQGKVMACSTQPECSEGPDQNIPGQMPSPGKGR